MTNNLGKPLRIYSLCLLIFSTGIVSNLLSQSTYSRPELTDDWKVYRKQVQNNPAKTMVELKTLIPDIVYDLRYATENNFMKRRMYPANTKMTYMRAPAVSALQKVQEELKKQGLGLKIFDAYRPYSVTVDFWELVKDERYVANPSKGSGHNRGIAVDLTIIDLKSMQELDMGTGFDNFTDTAHADFNKLPTQVLQNRNLLRSLMEKNGFKILDTEWWHFFLPESSKYEILDIDFKKFRKRS